MGPDGIFLSYCTWNRAAILLGQHRAVRIDSTTIQINDLKQQRRAKKRKIIADANRICYICKTKIPEEEQATIDHIIPLARDVFADRYDNMRCCCERCNKDKSNFTLSEYVSYIRENRSYYFYITDKQLTYLEAYAKEYEEQYYKTVSIKRIDFYNNSIKRKPKRRAKTCQ